MTETKYRVNGKRYETPDAAYAAAVRENAAVEIWDPETRNWREAASCEINDDEEDGE